MIVVLDMLDNLDIIRGKVQDNWICNLTMMIIWFYCWAARRILSAGCWVSLRGLLGVLSLGRIFGNSLPYCQSSHVDSIAVSVFADIFIELTNTVSDNNIQITILILWRGSCLVSWSDRLQFRSFCMQQEMLDLNYKAESKHNWLLLSSSPPRLKPTRIYSNMQCQ